MPNQESQVDRFMGPRELAADIVVALGECFGFWDHKSAFDCSRTIYHEDAVERDNEAGIA